MAGADVPFLNRLADALGVPELDDTTADEVLALAADVAHGSERKHAPLAAYLAGRFVAGGGTVPSVRAQVQRLLEADERTVPSRPSDA